MSVMDNNARAVADELPTAIRLGDMSLHSATSSRSVDIHGERRATDSSLHAFFFVGEVDKTNSPRAQKSKKPGGVPPARFIWYYSPLADFEKKRLRVEESVVAAAVSAALNLCAASNKKASAMASSPRMPQVYVRVGKTSTFRKYEYVVASPVEGALKTMPNALVAETPKHSAADATPPRLESADHAFAPQELDLSLTSLPTTPSRRSPSPSSISPLAQRLIVPSGLLTTEHCAGEHTHEGGVGAERSATVTVDVYRSIENGFETSSVSDQTYAEAGMMELPQHPPRQMRGNTSRVAGSGAGVSGGKPFTPLRDRVAPFTNGRLSRRGSAFRHRAAEEGGSSRTVDTLILGGPINDAALGAKTITPSPGGSSTPFLSCSMGRANSFQLSTSVTTFGNISGTATNGWIVNTDDGLYEGTEQDGLIVRPSLSRSQPSQAVVHPRPPRLVSPQSEVRRETTVSHLAKTLFHAPSAPKERRQPRRPQHTTPTASASSESTVPCLSDV